MVTRAAMRKVFTVEVEGESCEEFENLDDALALWWELDGSMLGWKYLCVDYVDEHGDYHPELARGLMFAQKNPGRAPANAGKPQKGGRRKAGHARGKAAMAV